MEKRVIEIWWAKYKLVRVIEESAKDIHHILGRKYRDKYNIWIEENKMLISRREHVDYNNFVKDKQNPREAMQKMYEMCKQILAPKIKEVLEGVLYNTEDEEFYIQEILKKKKKNLHHKKRKDE